MAHAPADRLHGVGDGVDRGSVFEVGADGVGRSEVAVKERVEGGRELTLVALEDRQEGRLDIDVLSYVSRSSFGEHDREERKEIESACSECVSE